ncbi:MAG: hypothetical protein QOH50_1973 [Kribbellaceae bacterium]|jgi:hypothetical protein|nr:hypothetical protein [Kribbellaceae bacterium]
MTERTDIAARALATDSEDLTEFAEQIADQIQSFLISVRDIAAQPDEEGVDEGLASLPYLLLEVSQLLLAGGRLGAFEDFVPDERFESDAGPDPDLDAMRDRLAILFEGLDEYAEVFDPYAAPPEIMVNRLSDDLTAIATDLVHGLAHYEEGRVVEALWWWQFSYVSTWGAAASAVLRAIQSLIAHDRLEPAHDPETEATDRELVEVAEEVVQRR